MTKYEKGLWSGLIAWVIVLVLSIGGWIANIVKLVGSTDPLSTGENLVRLAGMFIPPVGAIMGYV